MGTLGVVLSDKEGAEGLFNAVSVLEGLWDELDALPRNVFSIEGLEAGKTVLGRFWAAYKGGAGVMKPDEESMRVRELVGGPGHYPVSRIVLVMLDS
jgi:hypothetical protein